MRLVPNDDDTAENGACTKEPPSRRPLSDGILLGGKAADSSTTTTTTTTAASPPAVVGPSAAVAVASDAADDDCQQGTEEGKHQHHNHNNVSSSSRWLGTKDDDDGWELTWPIWHMLPRHERKELARKHGCHTIGEFEEYMSLQKAVGETAESTSIAATTTTNTSVAPPPPAGIRSSSVGQHEVPASSLTVRATDNKWIGLDLGTSAPSVDDYDDGDDCQEEGGDAADGDRVLDADRRAAAAGTASPDAAPLSVDDLVRLGGVLLRVPEDTLHRVFEYLPVDAYAVLAMVSPYWKPFTRTEPVYRRLCERLYLNQSQRRALHVGRFNNSYRTMLERRPRVRAGGGVYVLKYSRVQPIQRDMWTEVPLGAVLEHVYYRYLYFQENGRVLYALTTAAPHEVFRRFRKVCLTGEPDDAAVWGRYQVRKRHVTVVAQQPWQHVKLDLTIQDDAAHGRYGTLSFDSHVTNTSGNFDVNGGAGWCPNRVVYEVPEEPFRFVRDVRL